MAHYFPRLRYRPALSAVIIGTLALGIGASTALFSVIDAVLLRPFPFRDQQQLVAMWQTDVVRNHPFVEVSYVDARDWRARTSAFQSLAAMASVNFGTTLTGMGDPRQLQLRVVAESFFDVIGAVPLLGRTFTRDEHQPGSGHAVVIGHGVWQSVFAADPGVIGRSMTFDEVTHTIVGVMPPGFEYPEGAELWTTVEQAIPTIVTNRQVQWMVVVGRLRDGVSLEQARSALNLTIAQLAREYRPKADSTAIRAVVRPLVGELLGTTRHALWLLLCAVGAVLTIACVNVSNLLLSRAVDRRREIATRIVLGASRGRLARQLVGEVMPLAAAGGLIGVGIAGLALQSLVHIAGAELPRAEEIALDFRALFAATVLSIGAGLLCAGAPLLQSRDIGIGSALKDTTRVSASATQRRMRDVLVTAEIALALVLLVSGSLLVASFLSLKSQDLGFKPARILTTEVSLPSTKFQNLDQLRLAQRQLIERIRAIPGVEAASVVLLRPLWSSVGHDWVYVLEGQTHDNAIENPVANLEAAMPGYFDTMGIRLVAGRDFTERDTEQAPGAIIVSESFARSAWPGQDPLGRRLRVNLPSSPFDDQWLSVVGVVADVRYREIETSRRDLYQPYGQYPGLLRDFVIRTAGDPRMIAGEIRRTIHAVDRNQPVELMTMDEIVSKAMGRWRLNARLFGVLALLALLLSAVGTYSVVNYAVSRRIQEIGVRIALGAGQRQITRMVLKDGLRLAVLGIAVGSAAAVTVTGLLRHLLIGVSPHDPAAFVGAASLLCLVAALACFIPARRAAAVDPMVAMRTE
jgi:putative ABC transport system permease protein